jgi:hypothetical protein
MRGIQMGEISKLGWLMGFVEHAIRISSLEIARNNSLCNNNNNNNNKFRGF